MGLNRSFFYQHLHDSLFSKGLTQSQVDGLEAILNEWEGKHAAEDDRWLAYMLATAYHETGRTMQPVRETFANGDDQAIARLQKAYNAGKMPWVKKPYWTRDANGQSWYGRGLVQLTHKANYDAMKKALNVDLTGDPDLALKMDVSVRVLFYGMIKGSFTGHKLGDYFSGAKDDWVNARRMVNGLDRAKDIAAYGRQFYAALSYTV